MASSQLSTVLEHVRQLASAQSDELSDGQLLDRFVHRHEEAAFATLVRRHGPMVLGVCRRLLRDGHEAEDAFQATFLVLLRKARSLDGRGSVAGWLHAVAYHAALKARAAAARRQRHERQVGAMPQIESQTEALWRDLRPALDEELNRLPEKFRTPVVLCYVQGKTIQEAARLLSWPPGTVKSRLARARELLRSRLERRGVTLSAGLLGAMLGQHAAAAVPPRLADAAVRAVVGTRAPAQGLPLPSRATTALADSVMKVLLASRLHLVIALLLILSVGALGLGALAPAQDNPVRGPNGEKRSPPASALPGKKDLGTEKETLALTGRILDTQGRPLGGAEVAAIGLPHSGEQGWLNLLKETPLGQARADGEGRFRLLLPAAAATAHRKLHVLAGHPGHGLAWAQVNQDDPKAETVLRLPPEKVIRGRLQDLQGQPAAGVKVKVSWLGTPRPGELGTTRLGEVPKGGFTLWPGPVTTDREGKFEIRGVNPELEGYLTVESDRFAPIWQRINADRKRVQEVNLSLAPAQLIEGLVTAADTGKPLPHARLLVNSSNNPDSPTAMGPGTSGQADAQGRFRLNPPPGKMFTVRAEPPEGQPYLRLEKNLRWPGGSVRQKLDLALQRGVLVRGKVTESGSGKPVAGAVVRDSVGLWTNPSVQTGSDGTFQIAVAAGRGHLIIKGPNNDYIPLEVTHEEIRGGKPRGSRFYPDALLRLDLQPGSEPKEVAARLRRGVVLAGKLIGPDGKAPSSAVLLCWSQVRQQSPTWFAAGVPVQDGRFELRGCDPEKTYPVYFLDAKNRLGASVKLSAKEAQGKPVTVRLVPCGTATARFVDKAGNPLVGFGPLVYFVARPAEGKLGADDDFVANVDRLHYSNRPSTDKDGRCTFPALIPGATYRILDYDLNSAREITVQPGQNLTLPDIVIARPQ